MEIIENIGDIRKLRDNRVIVPENDNSISLINSQIIFNGKNNIVFLEKNIKIEGKIVFEGDDNIVFLCENKHRYLLNLTLYNQSVFYMGEHNYINGRINAILSERKHIIIGDGGLFSFGIWMRLADPHLIYDAATMIRKNESKSIFIGDHVWIGQGAMILKGTQIGSGSIIGAMSIVSGKKIPSNTSWAGNPAKQVGKDIFFTSACVHGYKDEQTLEAQKYVGKKYIYEYENGCTKDFEKVEQNLSGCSTTEERLTYLINEIRSGGAIYIRTGFILGAR